MGGIAVRVHGIPRPTHDVDFTVAVQRAGLPRVYEAVQAVRYGTNSTPDNAVVSGVVSNSNRLPVAGGAAIRIS